MKKIILIALFLSLATTVNATEFTPFPQPEPGFFQKVWKCKLSISCYREVQLGTAFTQITGTTLVSAYPAIQNANLLLTPNLTTENAFLTASSTTFGCYGPCSFGATATSTFNSAGVLTLISPLAVASGGTASTSPTLNQIMFGNGASGFKVIGFGTSGQFLTSGGDGSAPSWTTAAVNGALDYTWTGHHIFSSLFATAASSTRATSTSLAVTGSTLGLNGLVYTMPSVQGASSTVMANNGSGGLTFNSVAQLGAAHFLFASSTNSVIANNDSETTIGSGLNLNAGLLGTNGAIAFKIYLSNYSDTGGNQPAIIRVAFGGTQVCSITLPTAENAARQGMVEFIVSANNSASAQLCHGSFSNYTLGTVVSDGSSSVNTTGALAVTVTTDWVNEDPGDTETITVDAWNATFLGRQ